MNKSSRLGMCNICLSSKSCFFLGSRKSNLVEWDAILDPYPRYLVKKDIKFNDEIIDYLYIKYLEHMRDCKSVVTLSDVKFAKVISSDVSKQYDKRFIYYSGCVERDNISSEIKFLMNCVIDKKGMYEICKNYMSKLHMKTFAYSIAKKSDGSYRESFYLYFVNEKLLVNILNNLGIEFRVLGFEKLLNYAYDISNSKVDSYKVYSEIEDVDEFLKYLKDEFNFIFPEKLINISRHFYYVRRYDENKNLVGQKLEFSFTDFEFVRFELFESFGVKIEKDDFFDEHNIALDFDSSGRVLKTTVYIEKKATCK